ncbi:MAG: hypothetical protein KKB79_00310, partial [Nanoarchaeota archaeon]|nr:hypothetical protein [Nanoarchaeota archaeon]
MNKNLIGVLLVLLFIVLSIFIFKGNGDSTGSVVDGDSSSVERISISPLNLEYHLVEITSMGFSPNAVEIEQGD